MRIIVDGEVIEMLEFVLKVGSIMFLIGVLLFSWFSIKAVLFIKDGRRLERMADEVRKRANGGEGKTA